MDPAAIAQIDEIRLNFSPRGLMVINAAIGLMMLGVSMDLNLRDFRRIITYPRPPCIGLGAQFILLPAFTFLLTLILRPHPSIALGMILVASCPGGNLSNIMTYLAKGNCAVSITMTAVSTAAAIIMTPLNLSLWGSLNPDTSEIVRSVSLNPMDVFVTVFVILGIPLITGQVLIRIFPGLADRVRRPFKIFALVFFFLIVGGALAANWQYFIACVGLVMFAVFVHNALALNLGYWSGRAAGLNEPDCRAVCIEVGIQNSALGLVLVFNFFEGLGGMAILVAWWGVWHIIAGLAAAFIFTRIALPPGAGSTDGDAR
ncbi:MAG: bile acid:sodium symporter family protein [Thermodesulfobacteriota bacterium]